ncbi:hypothetical protein V2J09_020097 [Rumex salicifolius]
MDTTATATTTTELSLGLPGSLPVTVKHQFTSSKSFNKRASTKEKPEDSSSISSTNSSSVSYAGNDDAPPTKAQIVGWPPVRSSRKNINLQSVLYVKVSMDGAPYLRKIDLKIYKSYFELLEALESMFKITIGEYVEREGYNGSDYEPTYEDKDGDWMLVGDVPWEMFISSCKRLRIMKSSEAKGLGFL